MNYYKLSTPSKDIAEQFLTFEPKELKVVLSTLKKMIEDRKKELRELPKVTWAIESHIGQSKVYRDYKSREFVKAIYLALYVEKPRTMLTEEIKRYEQILRYLNAKGLPANKQLDVEAAKAVPVTMYVEFNKSGFAKCLWHNEKTPSMKYYEKNNKVWCFSCSKGGSVIDVVRQMYSLDFRKAVNLILHK